MDTAHIPVVEVHTGNIRELLPSLVLAIRSSTFVAIDTELSGLGDRKQLFSKAVDDRYKAISDVAKTRAVVSLGLSCFKIQPRTDDQASSANSVKVDSDVSPDGVACGAVSDDKASLTFLVQTFNVLVLCTENYVVEPLTLQFLVSHGFDFNRQYALGLRYTRGNDKVRENSDYDQTLRKLFSELITSRVPIVLHNALVDLVFLYESLYALLPSNLTTYLADLSEMFSAGIYDTKYIVEFRARWSASFLEYAFRKSVRDNCARDVRFNIVHPKYCHGVLNYIGMHAFGVRSPESRKLKVCSHFANHGWCSAGASCANSHDVELILDDEDCNRSRNCKSRKSGRKKMSSDAEACVKTTDAACIELSSTPVMMDCSNGENEKLSSKPDGDVTSCTFPVGGHRAGFDAFMTGYIFAWSALCYGQLPEVIDESTKICDLFGVANMEFVNRIYLGGKDFPLQVSQSCFAKHSKAHVDKWSALNADVQ